MNNRHDGEIAAAAAAPLLRRERIAYPSQERIMGHGATEQYALNEIPFEARNPLWGLHL